MDTPDIRILSLNNICLGIHYKYFMSIFYNLLDMGNIIPALSKIIICMYCILVQKYNLSMKVGTVGIQILELKLND